MTNSTDTYKISPDTTRFWKFDTYKDKTNTTDAKTSNYALYKFENGLKQVSDAEVSKFQCKRVCDNCFLGLSTALFVALFVAISFLAPTPVIALIYAATILVGGLLLIAYTNYTHRPEFITKKNLEEWVNQPNFSDVLYKKYNKETLETLKLAGVFTDENYQMALSFFEEKAKAAESVSSQIQSLNDAIQEQKKLHEQTVNSIAMQHNFSNSSEAKLAE